jgi:hypothetical protein
MDRNFTLINVIEKLMQVASKIVDIAWTFSVAMVTVSCACEIRLDVVMR